MVMIFNTRQKARLIKDETEKLGLVIAKNQFSPENTANRVER